MRANRSMPGHAMRVSLSAWMAMQMATISSVLRSIGRSWLTRRPLAFGLAPVGVLGPFGFQGSSRISRISE